MSKPASQNLKPTRYYLIVIAPIESNGRRYAPGDLITTPKGTVRSFGTADRAIGHKQFHLGLHFPVEVRTGAEIGGQSAGCGVGRCVDPERSAGDTETVHLRLVVDLDVALNGTAVDLIRDRLTARAGQLMESEGGLTRGLAAEIDDWECRVERKEDPVHAASSPSAEVYLICLSDQPGWDRPAEQWTTWEGADREQAVRRAIDAAAMTLPAYGYVAAASGTRDASGIPIHASAFVATKTFSGYHVCVDN